jgi:Family of unknown function (DUF5677)
MDLFCDGFLSERASEWAESNEARNRALFDHANQLRDLAFELAQEAGRVASSRQQVTLTMPLLRAISSFEGVILLSRRGMFVEARTIARNALETAFYIGALVEDSSFVDRMVADQMKHRKTLAAELLSDTAHADVIGADVLERLQRFLDDLDTSRRNLGRVVSEQAARRAGMGSLYSFFRDFSGDAHPTIQSLNRYAVGQEDVTAFRLQPDDDCAHQALAHAVPALYACVMLLQSVFAGLRATSRRRRHMRMFHAIWRSGPCDPNRTTYKTHASPEPHSMTITRAWKLSREGGALRAMLI